MTKLVLEAHGFTVDYTFQAKDKAHGPGGQRRHHRHALAVHRHRAHRLPRPGHGLVPDRARRRPSTSSPRRTRANGLCWTSETKFTDTNGIAIKASDKATYGDTLTAFGAYLASH